MPTLIWLLSCSKHNWPRPNTGAPHLPSMKTQQHGWLTVASLHIHGDRGYDIKLPPPTAWPSGNPLLTDPDNQIKIIKLMVFPTLFWSTWNKFHYAVAVSTSWPEHNYMERRDQAFVWVELQRRESRQSYGGEGEKVTEQARMVEVEKQALYHAWQLPTNCSSVLHICYAG